MVENYGLVRHVRELMRVAFVILLFNTGPPKAIDQNTAFKWPSRCRKRLGMEKANRKQKTKG